jgi:uncharacterized membrane protein
LTRLAPARFLWFLVVLVAVFAAYLEWRGSAAWQVGFAVAFDAAAAVFLLSLVPLVRNRTPDAIRSHALTNDANRPLMLVLTTVVALAVMVAVGSQLDEVSDGGEYAIAKLIGTLMLIWLFANSVFALHYAHAYYAPQQGRTDPGGLKFEGDEPPDYYDFAYFAFTLGMTFQTSDTAVSSRRLRRVAVVHSAAAFAYNIGVLAFTINVLGGSS